jgi:hypothetical protein
MNMASAFVAHAVPQVSVGLVIIMNQLRTGLLKLLMFSGNLWRFILAGVFVSCMIKYVLKDTSGIIKESGVFTGTWGCTCVDILKNICQNAKSIQLKLRPARMSVGEWTL